MRPLQKDVKDNCYCFTSDIFKVIAGNAHNYFKLLSALKERAGGRFQVVNWPLNCSEFFFFKTSSQGCEFTLLLLSPPSFLNNVYSTLYLESAVGRPLKSSPCLKLCFKGIRHPQRLTRQVHKVRERHGEQQAVN